MKKIDNILKESFLKYLNTGSRSNEKLKILHGYIADSIKEKLGKDYQISSLNIDGGKEETIKGWLYEKKVDITVSKIINNELKHIAGIAVKFVMSNYSQNSINYFENMLGETSNIRGSNIPYFQIFIIDHWMPYFDETKNISKWEEITSDKLLKYKELSYGDVNNNLCVPTKTLLYVVNKKFENLDINNMFDCKNFDEYKKKYLENNFNFHTHELEDFEVGESVVLNDYEKFINCVIKQIKEYKGFSINQFSGKNNICSKNK